MVNFFDTVLKALKVINDLCKSGSKSHSFGAR